MTLLIDQLYLLIHCQWPHIGKMFALIDNIDFKFIQHIFTVSLYGLFLPLIYSLLDKLVFVLIFYSFQLLFDKMQTFCPTNSLIYLNYFEIILTIHPLSCAYIYLNQV